MEGVSSSYKVFGMTAFLEKYQENLRQMGHFHLDHFAVFEGRHPRVVVCHLPQAVVDMHAAFSPEVVQQTRKEPDPKDPHHQSVWLVRGKKRGELSLFHLNRSLEEFPATQGGDHPAALHGQKPGPGLLASLAGGMPLCGMAPHGKRRPLFPPKQLRFMTEGSNVRLPKAL
jgi:hypothetical protein